MAYTDRIATQHPANLIAAEVPAFLAGLATLYPPNASGAVSYAQGAANRRLAAAVTQELREIWKLARQGDPAWRDRLAAVNAAHGKADIVVRGRWARLIEHSPR